VTHAVSVACTPKRGPRRASRRHGTWFTNSRVVVRRYRPKIRTPHQRISAPLQSNLQSTKMADPKPRLRIREAVPADATALAEIQFSAFGPDIINRLLFPNGVTEDALAKSASWLFTPPDAKQSSERLLTVAELVPEDGPADGPGEIVAFAKWSLRRQPAPEEEWNVEPPVMTPSMIGEGADLEAYKWFHGTLHRRFREIGRGDPMLCEWQRCNLQVFNANDILDLSVLVCAPHRQRLGAGSALLRWGTDLADSLGLASWLESSPYGYPLYKRHGYKDISVIDFEITKRWGPTKPADRDWGENSALEIGGPVAEGVLRTVIMKRPPKASQ